VLEAMQRQEAALRANRQPETEDREAHWAQVGTQHGPRPDSPSPAAPSMSPENLEDTTSEPRPHRTDRQPHLDRRAAPRGHPPPHMARRPPRRVHRHRSHARLRRRSRHHHRPMGTTQRHPRPGTARRLGRPVLARMPPRASAPQPPRPRVLSACQPPPQPAHGRRTTAPVRRRPPPRQQRHRRARAANIPVLTLTA
jgi:hypothetical protein